MAPRIPRRILQHLPAAWRTDLAAVSAAPVTRGMSGASVWRLKSGPERYLKVAVDEAAAALRQEISRTAWLGARGIRVARILRVHETPGIAAMETLAVPGTPADETDAPAERVLAVLGRGLAALHSLAVADCPFDESLPVRLARAQQALERDEVDPARFEPRNRHTAPRTLLARIAANPARRDAIVVAHGDASLSNLIVGPDGGLGFIDCGHAGRADRYLDLAVAGAEIAGHFGAAALPMFTRAYGLRRWNKRKAAYYEDLYEFF